MNGKRILSMTFVVVLLLALCACGGGSDEDAYYISFKEATICPGEAAGDLLDALGEPNFKKNNGNCGGQGVQMKYSYDSFDLYLLEANDGKVTVDEISLKDDLIETPKGIAIGSKKDAVLKAYGEPTKATDKTLVYEKGKQELFFELNDDSAVVAITIRHVTQ